MSVNLYKEAKRRETKEYEKKFNTPEAVASLAQSDRRTLSRADQYHQHRARDREERELVHNAMNSMVNNKREKDSRKVTSVGRAEARRLTNPGDELARKGDYATRLHLVREAKSTRDAEREAGFTKQKLHGDYGPGKSSNNPNFLSTRKGKAIAAGGALATVGALGGAYAYKKHLDKKRAENAEASTSGR